MDSPDALIHARQVAIHMSLCCCACHNRSCVPSSGDPTGAEKHAFHSLVWFDHSLRTVGPLFPFMLLATRYRLATLASEILAYDQQPWVEQIVVYIGLTITRLAIYFIHRLGKHAHFSTVAMHFCSIYYCPCPSRQQRLILLHAAQHMRLQSCSLLSGLLPKCNGDYYL